MATKNIPAIYDELLDYLVEETDPQKILAFKVSEKAQERADYLLERNNAGELSASEAMELEQILHFERRITVIKARAAAMLKRLL